jgi:hypothetical protein
VAWIRVCLTPTIPAQLQLEWADKARVLRCGTIDVLVEHFVISAMTYATDRLGRYDSGFLARGLGLNRWNIPYSPSRLCGDWLSNDSVSGAREGEQKDTRVVDGLTYRQN